MIPILYAANETVFTHNGLGLLADAIRCEVTEERNGIYEALIEYPITGIHCDGIAEDCIVKILPNEISNPQLFRIYKTGRPINGTITINLEHISYMLNGNPVTGYNVGGVGAAGAIQGALTAATFTHGFSAWSDITTLNSAKLDDPLSVRAILGGTAGGILDKWGGEYEFDNYVVKLHAQRGSATDVVIEYGKNLTDINQERNITDVYTSLFPYAKYVVRTPEGVETEHLVLLTENVLDAPNASSYAHKRAKIHDFSGDFDGEVTEAMLRAKALAYLAANPIDVPSVNIKVSFVQLWQTAEYANIAPLERVKLCDTITVKFSKLGITATAKVIKTVYDTLLERYINIELGTAKSNFAQTINNQQQQINTINQNLKIETGALKQAILDATAAITGNMSGNVIFHPSLENPQEILIMDTEDIATALKVWRWNSGGLGYSSTGYNGPYGTAITMDGEIVADMITAGVLRGTILEAGTVTADKISQSYKYAVTNEITEAKELLTQSFEAGNEHLLSQINASLVDYVKGTELLQTVDDITASFSQRFSWGMNLLKNSAGINGVDNSWVATGTVQAQSSDITQGRTVSNSEFRLSETSTLEQQVDDLVIGSDYIFSCKLRKPSPVNAKLLLLYGGEEHYLYNDDGSFSEWADYEYVIENIQTTSVTLKLFSSGDYLHIADAMLAQGSVKRSWTPSPNEMYTANVKIDKNGLSVSNNTSGTKTVINNEEFAVYNETEKVITVNQDETRLKKSIVEADLSIGKLKFLPVDGGVNAILLD